MTDPITPEQIEAIGRHYKTGIPAFGCTPSEAQYERDIATLLQALDESRAEVARLRAVEMAIIAQVEDGRRFVEIQHDWNSK